LNKRIRTVLSEIEEQFPPLFNDDEEDATTGCWMQLEKKRETAKERKGAPVEKMYTGIEVSSLVHEIPPRYSANTSARLCVSLVAEGPIHCDTEPGR